MNAPLSIPQLRAVLAAAKARENEAKQDRLQAEESLLAFFPNDKPEGTITDKDNGITVSYGVTRKADTAALQNDWMALSANAQKAFRWSADVDTRQLKALQDLDLTTHTLITKYITTTPKKPTITLKD
jgi:hypothetical protein